MDSGSGSNYPPANYPQWNAHNSNSATNSGAKIKVFGIGGAGLNAVNNMIKGGLEGVEFYAANTDAQALASSLARNRIQLGRELTKGLGAGANPDVGYAAAQESIDDIRDSLSGADMVFITAGMGGGTGSLSASVVARAAREEGALAVGVVTKPFLFEGKRRMRNAERGVQELKKEVDTLIIIPNQRLLAISGRNTALLDTFKRADDVLFQAVKGISDLIVFEGLVNVDFADVRAVMSEMGMAMMGTGEGSGENRALEAAEKAISSPLLEDVSIKGARGILINVTASPDVTLQEVNEAAELVHSEAHEEANIIWGMVIDPTREDSVRVTVIATGFGDEREVAFTDRGVSLGVRGGRGQLGNMGNTGHNSGHTGNPYLPSSNAPQPVTIQNQYQEPEMARAENDMGNIDAPSYTRKPNAPVVKLNRLNVVGDEKVDGGYAEEIPPFLRRS